MPQAADHRQYACNFVLRRNSGRVRPGGFATDVQNGRALAPEALAMRNRLFGRGMEAAV